LCQLKSGFFHSELKSGYIRANTASLGLHLLSWPSKIIRSYIWLVINVLFPTFLVTFMRQRQDSKRFIALLRVPQYQNSQAYQRNHYPRTFLVIVRLKQNMSNTLKCCSSLFTDILLHYGVRSSLAEMFWFLNVTMGLPLQCR